LFVTVREETRPLFHRLSQNGTGGFSSLSRTIVLSVLLAALLFAGLGCRNQASSHSLEPAAAMSIEKQPPTFAIRTFDPATPPADMPPISGGEQAFCDSNLVSTASVKGQPEKIDATHAALTVIGVKVTLELKITIWVPKGVTQHVMDHEQGHRQISEHYYETADKVAQQIAACYVGRQVSVSGANLDEAISKQLQQLSADITAEYNDKLNPGPAQQRYDDLTNHARNDVVAGDAVAQVLQEFP
jgi:hypothetical protein